MRPAAMPARFEEALDVVREYVARHGTDDDRDLVHRVEARRGAFHGWCERLAESPVPPSLDHNDLHAWNVLGGDGEEPRFYDWGDAVVSHPFASMLMGLGFTKFYVEVSGDADPRLTRLRDAYLEPFADLAPHHELVSTLELACRVGKVARTLVWDRAVRSMGDAAGEAVRTPLISLGSVLDESYVGVT
jgi:aminoglycoside phosphotransferase (APT) family kinase protein